MPSRVAKRNLTEIVVVIGMLFDNVFCILRVEFGQGWFGIRLEFPAWGRLRHSNDRLVIPLHGLSDDIRLRHVFDRDVKF